MKKYFKRLMSALLAILMVSASFVFAPVRIEAAGERYSLRFDEESKVSLFSNANNLNVTYSKAEKSMLMAVTGTGSDPFVLLNVEKYAAVSADAYKYAVITYRTPVTNSAKALSTELFMSAGNIQGPTGGCSVTYAPVNGYKYRSQVIDMSSQSYWNGQVHSIRFDVFSEGTVWDSFYLYSVTFCTTAASANAAVVEETAAANGVTANISEQALASNAYSLDTYALNEYWRGSIVYNESVYPLLNADGTISPIPLMYSAERIISVRDGTLGTEYKYGRDYIVSDGKLVIIAGGGIPTINYANYKRPSAPDDTTFWQPCRDGSYTFFSEGAVFHRAQLSVTYTHADIWKGPVPESKISNLPKTVSRLNNKEHLTVVFNGDSITYGANASGLADINVSPKMPLWADMTIAGLKSKYGYTNISYANTAVGGKTSAWGVENAYDNIAKYGPDLVFIAFGANDGTLGVTPADFKANIEAIMGSAKAVNSNCEFVLVAPMLANAETYFSGLQPSYLEVLLQLEGEGVAVADMTSIHSYLLGIKKYSDMTGNNVNHPNDFLIRFYAQTMLATLTPSELNNSKNAAAADLNSYANFNLYLDAEKEILKKTLESGLAAINAADSEKAVRDALAAAKNEIDKIKTAAEYEAENLDYTKLVFTNAATLTTISAANHLTVSLDHSSNGATATVTGDDPWFRISYPAGKASADVYKYVVLVYKVPDNAASSNAQMFYTAGNDYYETGSKSKIINSVKGDFTYQVIDLSKDSYWHGDIHSIRLDPFESAPSGNSMTVHSVCLFDSKEKAAEYGAKTAASLSNTYIGRNEYISFTTEEKAAAISADGSVFDLGDLNVDGKINVADLSALRLYLVCIAPEAGAYPDINTDGVVSIKDTLILKKIIGGHIPSPGTYSTIFAECKYSSEYKSAAVSALGGGAPRVKIDVSGKSADSADFKYITLTYFVPEGVSSVASVYIETKNGTSKTMTFDITPNTTYQSVTLDFSSSVPGGTIENIVLSLPASSKAQDTVYIDSVTLSDTPIGAGRARDNTISAANNISGIHTRIKGESAINLNGSEATATYSYYTGVSADAYTYTNQLIVKPDRQPDEKFDRFSLGYTSSTLARGVITYAVNGIAVQDEFYLEKADNKNTFNSLINGYFAGELASEIISITINPVMASSSTFSLKSAELQDFDNYSGTLYLENSQIKLGILLDMGGGISHYEKKDDNNANYTNLLNSYDVGRLIQQSYYGIDKAPYELGNMGGTPWRYNPVQGGDIANNPSRIIDIQVSKTSVYVKVRPMDWGHNGHITPSYMENNYTLYDSFVKVDNRFVDFSGYTHTAASQELPAFYTVSALSVFSMYNGDSPWSGGAYASYPNLQFWGGNSSQYYSLKSTSEYWYTFTDTTGFGIGLYVPNVSTVLAGRYIPETQSYDPKANPTCYFAPLRQMTLKSGKPLSYSYLICAGNIAVIRDTFKNNRSLINNSSLSSY